MPARRGRRRRVRPITPRRAPASPQLETRHAPDLVIQAEGSLIAEWQRARAAGDLKHADELAEFLYRANRSVVERAARTHRSRIPLPERRQVAALALLRALVGFDATRGVPFAAYARYWFDKEFRSADAAGGHAVAIPVHRLGAVTQDHGDASTRALATAGPIGDEADIADPTADPEAAAIAAAAMAALHDGLASLDERRRLVVQLRYGLADGTNRSNREVARLLGISEFTVRADLARAHRLLRTRLGDS